MISPDPGSFRDPASRVVLDGDKILRLLDERGLQGWRALAATEFFTKAVSDGKVIAASEVDPPSGSAGALEHPRLPLISYPYEWTFSMLKDAALLQLDLLEGALHAGLTIKDSTPYNIQFVDGRPIFIDIGSFEAYRQGEPWIGYRQFTKQFLFPLMLRSWVGVPFQPWLRGDLEGLTPTDMARLLGGKKRFNTGALLHVRLQARMEARMSDRAVREDLRSAGFTPELILANVKKLRSLVTSLVWEHGVDGWSDYGSCTHVSRDRDTKSEFLQTALDRAHPMRVLDLGANDGHFSAIAAKSGAQAIALDSDEAVLDDLYRRSVGQSLSVVLTDLGNPSPAQGWAGGERPGIIERARPDLVIAYGLIHHLIYSASIPPYEVMRWLRSFDTPVLVEFVSPDDEMVAKLAGNKLTEELHRGRDEEEFRRMISEMFSVVREQTLGEGTRVLFDLEPAMSLERLGTVRWWIVPLSLGTVAAFAFGQPLLDLLGHNPDFFIAGGLTSLDVILFPIAVLLIPVLLAIPVLALRLVGPRTAGLAHAILIGILFALMAASAWITLLGADPPSALFALITVGSGVVFAIGFTRYPLIQSAVVYASLALVFFAGWFLVMTPASDVAFADASDLPEIGDVPNPVPIIVMVFDEFPVATLIDSDGSLLDSLFPNFSTLAADSVWYRNAVGVRQQTQEALPTILTGVGADLGSVPTSSDHPLNLFTLFSDTYDVAAMEIITSLCPDFACENSSRHIEPLAVRWSSTAVDLSVIYGHVTMPKDIADRLPPIDEMWGNFTSGQRSNFDIIDRFLRSVDDDRRDEVSRFLDTLEVHSTEPPLRFGHFLYPHHPWVLTADGQLTGVTGTPGSTGTGWSNDNWLVGQGYQRHILQAQYADTILGKVIARLKDEGIYDDALFVVLADHGIAISPGVENQRTMTPDTVGTIAAVPLFVKYPSQFQGVTPGSIDDIRAQTDDILPTVADVVGIKVPWAVDGLSLLDSERRAERTESVMVGKQGSVAFGVSGTEKLAAAAEKEVWFPNGDPWSLAPPGWEGWLGRSIADLNTGDVPEVKISLLEQGTLDDLAPEPEVLPVFLSGQVSLDQAATGEEIVVITVDGKVRAVTRTYEPKGKSARFQAMVSPEWLHPGANDVVAWLAAGPDSTSLQR